MVKAPNVQIGDRFITFTGVGEDLREGAHEQ